MKLSDYEAYYFLIVALMWLLPMVGVGTGTWGGWVATIAIALVGIGKLQK